MSTKVERLHRAFVWRRLHSLLGLWLVIYLIEHLLTNSQAALWIGDDGAGFVRMVNALQNLPYLRVIEIVLLGIPFFLHAYWGVKILLKGKFNSYKTDGSKPSLPEHGRNRAYTWQRLTSWILLIGIILHVVQMRFMNEPVKVVRDNAAEYLVKLNFDEGLYTLAPRLNVELFNQEKIAELQEETGEMVSSSKIAASPKAVRYDQSVEEEKRESVVSKEESVWVKELAKFKLKNTQVVAAAPSAGAAILLATRDTFKSPLMGIFYTLFVLAAAFHAFNGLWTFLITWGAILSLRSQKSMVNVCIAVMAVFMFLGLAAIWGSYWINLRS
jgi:succinate dehydrogenase / fumarate reductase, cytochrome b subunit